MSFTRADIAGHITRSNACRFFTMSASVVPVDSTVIESGLSPALYAARKKSPTPAAPSPKRNDASARIQRAAVCRRDVQQLVLDERQTVNRLDAGLGPAAEMCAHSHPLAAPLELRP